MRVSVQHEGHDNEELIIQSSHTRALLCSWLSAETKATPRRHMGSPNRTPRTTRRPRRLLVWWWDETWPCRAAWGLPVSPGPWKQEKQERRAKGRDRGRCLDARVRRRVRKSETIVITDRSSGSRRPGSSGMRRGRDKIVEGDDGTWGGGGGETPRKGSRKNAPWHVGVAVLRTSSKTLHPVLRSTKYGWRSRCLRR